MRAWLEGGCDDPGAEAGEGGGVSQETTGGRWLHTGGT